VVPPPEEGFGLLERGAVWRGAGAGAGRETVWGTVVAGVVVTAGEIGVVVVAVGVGGAGAGATGTRRGAR
jgi:hypothetical protein